MMSLERRFALLQGRGAGAARGSSRTTTTASSASAGAPLPTLKSIDATGLVIYVGTFSKSLFPALRLGYFLAPPALVADLRDRARRLLVTACRPACRRSSSDFIDEGQFATHIRRMRKLYAERYQVFFDAARDKLAPWLDIVPTNTGLHTIGLLRAGLLRAGVTGAAVSAAAAERGLTVAPISRFCIAPIDAEGLVLGFSGITPPQIAAGIAALREVLAASAPVGPPPTVV